MPWRPRSRLPERRSPTARSRVSQPDLDRLTPADRAALTDELFAWVSDGPPRASSQIVAGVQLFEDRLPSGISVTYFVDEQVPYIGVVRVRRR